MANDLDYLDKVFEEVEGARSTYRTLPKGSYVAKITQNHFLAEKSIFERKFKVLEGDYVGIEVTDWIHLLKKDGFANEVSLDRFKAEVGIFNPEWKKRLFSEICIPFCEASYGADVEIYVATRQKKDYSGCPQVDTFGSPVLQSTIYINKFRGQHLPETPSPGQKALYPGGAPSSPDCMPF